MYSSWTTRGQNLPFHLQGRSSFRAAIYRGRRYGDILLWLITAFLDQSGRYVGPGKSNNQGDQHGATVRMHG